MLRRDFIAGAAAMPIVTPKEKSRIAIREALDLLRSALENDPDIDRFEIHFDMTAPVAIIVAAYQADGKDYTPSA